MKIGIKPILVLLPGHMYMGHYPIYFDYLTQSTCDGYINNIYTLDQVISANIKIATAKTIFGESRE